MNIENLEYDKITLANETNIEYKLFNQSSKKTAITFLYGLVCNNNHFTPQINFFIKNGFPVLILNYRHHFGSTSPGGIESCTLKNISKDTRLLLSRLNIKKTHLVGHSMGVNVAIDLSICTPELVEKIAVISGNPMRPQDYMFNTNLSTYIFPALKKILNINKNISTKIWQNMFHIKLVRKIVLDGGFNPEMVTDRFVKFYMKKIGELGFELFFQLIEEMKNHNLSAKLHLVEKPVLVMGGDLDKIAPIEGQILFNKYIKDSQLYLIKDGSHVPQIDFPKTVNKELLSFFE